VETDPDAPGMRGLDIARVDFSSLSLTMVSSICVLSSIGSSRMAESADSDTGMWVVELDSADDGELLPQ